MALDRATSLRTDPAWVTERLGDPASRAVFASRDGVLVAEGDPTALLRRPLAEIGMAGVTIADPVLLGLDAGRALFAVDLDALPRAALAASTRGGSVMALRAAGPLLPRPEGGLGAYLMSMLGWHRTHRFCPNCGTPTEVAEAGTRGDARAAAPCTSPAPTRW